LGAETCVGGFCVSQEGPSCIDPVFPLHMATWCTTITFTFAVTIKLPRRVWVCVVEDGNASEQATCAAAHASMPHFAKPAFESVLGPKAHLDRIEITLS